ncbi:MAG: hypothetical protein RBS43_05950 [Candidatus Cloacimonas sp.]|nr:hypothetical protein [Candidatus Cloacimonas sp.]
MTPVRDETINILQFIHISTVLTELIMGWIPASAGMTKRFRTNSSAGMTKRFRTSSSAGMTEDFRTSSSARMTEGFEFLAQIPPQG